MNENDWKWAQFELVMGLKGYGVVFYLTLPDQTALFWVRATPDTGVQVVLDWAGRVQVSRADARNGPTPGQTYATPALALEAVADLVGDILSERLMKESQS